MYLKALEIQGFKSFAEKTRLTFEKNITAIVGPNGSGKSNISDAILWVMGEQRSKALRGSKMEDVIFGGTEKRGALGYAQVSLIIDNSKRIFDYDSDEITLTRRYYRSGESEYYINREAVRLKDLNALLMDTGLGRDGYSIIGQGRIAEIVSTKSTDRRDVFEEAAGISRFRYRKEEAERKLQKTQENLLRINDKIEELEMQLEPLKRQSELAKRYLLLRDELRIQEISAWMATLDKLHEQSDAVNAEYEQTKSTLEQAKAELEALYVSSGSIRERMRQKDIENEQARERLSSSEALAAACEAAAAVLRADIKSNAESMQRMLDDIAEQADRVQGVRDGINENAKRVAEIDERLSALAEESVKCANIIDGCRMKLKSRDGNVALLSDKMSKLTVDMRSIDSRVNMLREMEKAYEGYSRAVKTVMREKARGTLRGIHAPAANLLRVEDDCALAIETALGAAGQNIITDTQSDARSAIDLLKNSDSGRATFLPLDTIKGAVLKELPVNDPGYVGLASDIAHYDEAYRQIFESLLGRTVVCEGMSDAIRISNKSGNRLRIVTLDGQLINAGGSMTGGSSAKGVGAISRANELERLDKQLERLKTNEATVRQQLDRAKTELASVRYQLDVNLDEQSELKSQSSSAEAEKRALQSSTAQLNMLLKSLTGDNIERQNAVETFKRKDESFNLRLREKQEELCAINEQSSAIREEIKSIGDYKLELEGKRTKADKESQQRNADILDLERRMARIEQRKLAADMEEKQIMDKLWESYELSHGAAQEIRRPIESLAKANKHISELRRDISALGTPNLGAVEEYERVSTRYDFLSGQRSDIDKAKKELDGIISDITAQMKELFTARLKEIDAAFRQTFLELFGGGKASLILEDENDVLNCGIEIKVQPPGKALSSISLMSGGEMAFVAIALYFAILKVRPTPFCVMDEIEAALDEANVTRYAEYMRRMANNTQFLVITHRRGTMEEADMLYGVTMQEKGISTVIELDLENAQKTIE